MASIKTALEKLSKYFSPLVNCILIMYWFSLEWLKDKVKRLI
jgi:hypothetical protein